MPSRLIVLLVSLLLATLTVIFWLWLLIVPARVATLCPEECECDTAGFHVQCTRSLSITTVPFIRLTDTRVLLFAYSNITLIKRDSFVPLTELERLTMERCGVRRIELGAFNGLAELTELKIVNNVISEIIPGTFENLRKLENLNLGGNRLEQLDSDVFSALVNLKCINLAGNKLQYVHPDTFLGLPNIHTVVLRHNPALQIPTDRNFINSLTLSKLDISICNVSLLSVKTFANISALEQLDLSKNNLKTVDINTLSALPKLSEVDLFGNPLQCDCQLQEVWRWCADRNIVTGNENIAPECDTPSEVEGIWWGVLEKGECLQGVVQYCGDYSSTRYSDTGTANSYRYIYDVEILKHYQLPIYVVSFMFGTASNVILLIIIICNKDLQNFSNMYIVNLAISDIIYLTVLFSEACAGRISDTWLHGEFMCRFLPFCRRLSVGLSAYSVAVLSIQRYRVIVNPFNTRVSLQETWRVFVATVCGVWIVAALFAIPSAMSKYQCEGFTFMYPTPYYQLVVIFELLVCCVLPLWVISFTYIMAARLLIKNTRSVLELIPNPQLNTRRHTGENVVGLNIVFLISYVPYHVLWTYIVYTTTVFHFVDGMNVITFIPNEKVQYMYLISTIFLLINPCLNPLSLFYTGSLFRQHLKRHFACFFKTNFPPTDKELLRKN